MVPDYKWKIETFKYQLKHYKHFGPHILWFRRKLIQSAKVYFHWWILVVHGKHSFVQEFIGSNQCYIAHLWWHFEFKSNIRCLMTVEFEMDIAESHQRKMNENRVKLEQYTLKVVQTQMYIRMEITSDSNAQSIWLTPQIEQNARNNSRFVCSMNIRIVCLCAYFVPIIWIHIKSKMQPCMRSLMLRYLYVSQPIPRVWNRTRTSFIR